MWTRTFDSRRMVWLAALAMGVLAATPSAHAAKALFDNTHAETAGNADWQIDTDQPLPVPAQSTVTPATPRTYWLGANSSWAIDLVKRGYEVATLTSAYGITYGNGANPYDLSNYDVFIVNEPNTRFTAAESTAIFDYIRDGGGLIAVADHYLSDRNGDGFDSPRIWNLLDPQKLLGVHFNVAGDPNNNISQDSGNHDTDPANPIIFGPNGVADSVSFHGGTTMTLDPAANPSVTGDIWMTGQAHGTTNVMVAHSVYGSGRIVWVGDSSPADDGSAAPGNSNIFDGWAEVSGRDSLLHLNATMWATRLCADPPAVDSLRPEVVSYGGSVTIDGDWLAPTTEVRFNGTPASFTVNSNTRITATVPPLATAGPIEIIAPCGSDTSAEFFYPPLWPACGVPVNRSGQNQQASVAVSDGAGGVIVAWWDQRTDAGDIYAQRMSPDGQPLWPTAGVALCTAANAQGDPRIVSDGAKGAIVCWTDQRAGVDVYAQRVDSSGVTRWTANGVPVVTATGSQSSAVLTSDGAGGAIVAWTDFRNANGDIFARRLSAAGAPMWTSDGVALCTTGHAQFTPAITSDGAGGAIVIWQDLRTSPTSDIYAQRVNDVGSTRWSLNGVPLCGATNNQIANTIVADGSGGAILAWQDLRSGNYDVYVQRVNQFGSAQWTSNGVVVGSGSFTQAAPAILADGIGGAIVAWEDRRNGSTASFADISARKIDATGASVWTVVACAADSEQSGVTITTDGAGGAIIGWRDGRGPGVLYDLYAQRVDLNGLPSWDDDGMAICVGLGDKQSLTAVTDGAGGALLAWSDGRNGAANMDIYAVRARSTGVVTGVRPPARTDVALLRAWPNPFHDRIEVSFDSPVGRRARIEVLDIAGRRVWGSPFQDLRPGRSTLVWNGRGDGGRRLPHGIYFVRVRGPGLDVGRTVVRIDE